MVENTAKRQGFSKKSPRHPCEGKDLPNSLVTSKKALCRVYGVLMEVILRLLLLVGGSCLRRNDEVTAFAAMTMCLRRNVDVSTGSVSNHKLICHDQDMTTKSLINWFTISRYNWLEYVGWNV